MKIETKKDREKRSELVTEARQIMELAEKEEKELTSDESEKVENLLSEVVELEKKIQRADRLNELSDEQEEKLEQEAEGKGDPVEKVKEDKEVYEKAFFKYLQVGEKHMDAEGMKLLLDTLTKAQQTTTDSEGGYLIPEGFSNKLEIALLEFGGMREVSTIFKTATGNVIPWPTVNTTSQKGRWLAEGTEISEQDVVFASTNFEAWTASSDLIKVSVQLLQDSFFDLPAFLTGVLAERLGRLTNEDYTAGSGSSQPHGVVGASTLGTTAASPTALTFNELIDLQFSVNSAYRKNGRWMFNDVTLKTLTKLKDSDGRYIWNPDITAGVQTLLFGKPYTINDDIATASAGTKPILFGDFKKYHIRDVVGFTLLRLNELFAANLQVGFVGFLRTDGKLIDAGTHPVKHLIMAVS